MPGLRVGGSRRTNTFDDLRQRLRPIRRPQPNGPRVEVNVVCKVVPVSSLQLRGPLGFAAGIPAEGIIRLRCAAELSVFEFGEVTLLRLDPVIISQVDDIPRRKQFGARS